MEAAAAETTTVVVQVVSAGTVVASVDCGATYQGLKLVHFSAQRKHILWDTLGA
jgi:hypothetical protein